MSGDGENGSLPILKTLVDSLVNTLTRLSIRQESLEKDLAKVSEFSSQIPEIGRLVGEIRSEQKQMNETLLKARADCEKGIKAIEESIKPVSSLSELIRKPLATVVLFLVLIGTAYGLFKMFEGMVMKPTPPTPTNSSQVAPTNQPQNIP